MLLAGVTAALKAAGIPRENQALKGVVGVDARQVGAASAGSTCAIETPGTVIIETIPEAARTIHRVLRAVDFALFERVVTAKTPFRC